MGFKNAKSKVIECLTAGYILHEQRNEIDVKNLLSTGAISVDEVVQIIKRSNGNDYSTSPHDYDQNIDVHILKTKFSCQSWYIKWYFSDPDSVFISVHN